MTNELVRRSIAAAFALIMISGTLSADACKVATTFFVDGSLTDAWGFRTAIALGISMLVVALFYLIGKGMGSPEITNRAKTDLNQVFVSAVIIVLFGAFVSGICAIDARQFGLPRASLFDNARAYFEYARSTAIAAYAKTGESIMLVSGISSIWTTAADVSGQLVGVSMSIMPFAGFNSAISSLQFMMNLVLTTVAVSSAWIAVLTSIETAFLQLLLPTGILLRCFMPTRELGGVLVAISIGLFLFYPLLFSISYLALGKPDEVPVPDVSYAGKINGVFYSIAGSAPIPLAGPIILSSEYNSLESTIGNKIIRSMTAVGDTLLPIFILPAINWIILAELVRGMSRALGEEVDIGTLARMI